MTRRMSLAEPMASIAMDHREIERVMDRLDRAEGIDLQGRAHLRIPYRRQGVKLSLEHPGHSHSVFSVWTRNLSKGGVSVLLGTFVHPGSRCEVQLPCVDGQVQPLLGVVRWSRLIEGVIHESGIEFEDELKLELFINVATLQEHQRGAEMAAPVSDRADLLRSARELMSEIDDLVELPRLNRGREICKRLQQIGSELGWQELCEAAESAIKSLKLSGSIARSEPLLRKVQALAARMR
jgi:hypothetical protein